MNTLNKLGIEYLCDVLTETHKDFLDAPQKLKPEIVEDWAGRAAFFGQIEIPHEVSASGHYIKIQVPSMYLQKEQA
jgi:hypothetical protein